jgi:uncharacterized membrane protein
MVEPMAIPSVLLDAFLIGCVCGLRSMTAPAVVAWGAHLGWLHLQGGLLAFFANKKPSVLFLHRRHPSVLLASYSGQH